MADLKVKTISPQALIALKDALVHIYWKKQDIRKFIEMTIKNNTIVSTIDWETNRKVDSIGQLIDRMGNRLDLYFEDLLLLIKEASNMNDFTHLKQWDDGETKMKNAREAVERLRAQSQGYFHLLAEQQEIADRKSNAQERMKNDKLSSQTLEIVRNKYFEIAAITNPQRRGFEFEKLLNDVFKHFDLDPKASFKINGEQIDGAFTFDNTDYLLEAKWQEKPINTADLYTFTGKIKNKLKSTLGLFISLNGFSSECQTSRENSVILMDGLDLMLVLDGRIDLKDILYLKRRHASQTGEIFYRVVV